MICNDCKQEVNTITTDGICLDCKAYKDGSYEREKLKTKLERYEEMINQFTRSILGIDHMDRWQKTFRQIIMENKNEQ